MVVWSPLRFNCGRETANRFAIAPLTTDSSHEDGTATENELEFVRRRAASGFGATVSSAAYVEQDGRSWQGIGAAHDGHLSSLHRLAEAMRAAGGLAILQIYDGGRIAKPELIGEQCLRAPSAVASLRPGAKTPRAMTANEVGSLIAGFRVTPFETEPDGYTLEDAKLLCNELAKLGLDYISVSLDDYRKSRPVGETRVYDGPVEKSYTPAESPITEFARVIAGRSAVMASGGIKTCIDAEGAIKMGADLVAVGRAVVVDPEWFSKVRSNSEASILAGLPKDELDIAGALSIPPRMVAYLLSRPGWIPRF